MTIFVTSVSFAERKREGCVEKRPTFSGMITPDS